MLVYFLRTFSLFLSYYICIFLEPPLVSAENSRMLVSPGDDIDLKCDVAGETYPDIRWFKENELVSCFSGVSVFLDLNFSLLKVTRHHIGPNGVLHIKLASEQEDSGNYTCVVQNTVGSSWASILLDVGSKNKGH